jgi:hypothetical protein
MNNGDDDIEKLILYATLFILILGKAKSKLY